MISCVREMSKRRGLSLLTVELTAVWWDLQRREVVAHEGLAVSACVGPGSIVHNDLLLRAVPGQDGLLDVVEKRHEVVLVGGWSQLHHSAVLEASTNRSDHCYSHLPGISHVKQRLTLLAPALRLRLHGGVRGLVNPDQLVRLRPHQVSHQPAERTSLQRHSLRLINKLPEHSLAGTELDVVLLVESPHSVRRDMAAEMVFE